MPRLSRRMRTLGFAALVVAVFVGGVLTGVIGSRQPQPATEPSVIEEAATRIHEQAARPIDREVLERAAVEGMLKALGDRWSTYFETDEFAAFEDALEGRYAGVGLWLRQSYDGEVVVASVQQGTPAADAGMLAGDRLVSVDGRALSGHSLADVVLALRGADGSRVAVAVRRSDGDQTFDLTRVPVASEDVVTERLAGNVLRIRVESFSRGVGREIRAALDREKGSGLQGVVLDVRGNGGGLLDEAVEVAAVFLDGGDVVTVERRGVASNTLEALGVGDVTTPLVVLVDSGTASAAEILAGALQDRNRAVVVGSRTFGKGSVQEPARLSDGSAIELTVGRYLLPSGRAVDHVGIEPDVQIPPDAVATLAERRAIEVLTGLTAAMSTPGRG
jgi:carboxyl-terminal processing protease